MATDWSKYKTTTTVGTSGTDWSKYKTGATIQPTAQKSDFFGGVGTFLKGLTMLPKSVAASILQATQGKKGASVVEKDWADRFIESASKDINKFVQETQGKYGEAKLLPGMPFKITDIAQLPQSLGFSLSSMGVGAAAAVPVALTGIGVLASGGTMGAVSGATAYSMTTYQIMQEYLNLKDQEKRTKTGKGLTKQEEEIFKSNFDKKATQYGLWEAVPEGLSNLVFAGAWSKPFTAALGKTVGKNIAGKVAGAVAKTYASELATETITQKGQSIIEAEIGLREGKIGWTDAFKEVFPQTFLLTTIFAGAGATVIPIAKARAKVNASLEAEAKKKNVPLDSNLYQETKKQIDQGFAELQGEKPIEEQPTQIPQQLITLAQEARKYKSAEEFVKAKTNAYHGSYTKIDKFEKGYFGDTTANNEAEVFYFTKSPKHATEYSREAFARRFEGEYYDKFPELAGKDASGNYGGDLMKKLYEDAGANIQINPSFVDIKKPKVINWKGESLAGKWEDAYDMIRNAKEKGYDGVIFKNISDDVNPESLAPQDVVIAFEPEQIVTKSQLTDIYNQAIKTEPDAQPQMAVSKAGADLLMTAMKEKIIQKGDMPTHERTNLAQRYDKAVQFILQNFQQAKEIALGRAEAPAGYFKSDIYEAVEAQALLTNNVELIEQLKDSTVPTQAGQELVGFKGTDELNPIDRIKEVRAVLKEVKAESKKKELLTKVKGETKKKNLTKSELETKLSKFIDDNIC